MEYVSLLSLGIAITMMGSANLKGNRSAVHGYNRRKVSFCIIIVGAAIGGCDYALCPIQIQ